MTRVFDLGGPSFLLFFALLVAATYAAVILARRALSPGGLPARKLTDPILIAHLRGGPREAVRVALVELVRRGLVTLDGRRLFVATDALDRTSDPFEREIITACRGNAMTVDALRRAPELRRGALARRAQLVAAGLVTSANGWIAQGLVFLAGALTLGLTAAHKVQLGLERGRPVELLVFMATVAVVALPLVAFRRRTRRGQRVLADLRVLLSGARRGISEQSGPSLTLVAAACGVGALSAVPAFASAGALFDRASWAGGSSSGGSGCGAGGASSSCGASGGASCGGGSSCGGGGCGGCGGGGS